MAGLSDLPKLSKAKAITDLARRTGIPKSQLDQALSPANKRGDLRAAVRTLDERADQVEAGLITQREFQQAVIKAVDREEEIRKTGIEKKAAPLLGATAAVSTAGVSAQTEEDVTAATDAALLAGASIDDLNEIRSRTGRSTFTEIESENPLLVSVDVPVNPLDTASIVVDENQSRMSAARAGARAISVGADPVNAYNNAVDAPLAGQADEDAVKTAASMGMDAVVAATERLALANELNMENVEIVVEEDITALQDPVLGKYLAHIKTMENSELLTQEVQLNMAAGMHMQQAIGAIWDDMTKAGVAADIAGLFFIPDAAWNAAELLEEFFPEASFVENYVNSADGLLRLRTAIQALPPRQKVAVFNQIADLYKEIDDNQLQQIFGLLELFDPAETGLIFDVETGIKVDQFFDKLTVVTAGAGGLLRLNRLTKTANVAKVAAATQDAETAGQVTHVVTQSEEVAKAVGISKVDAAAGADPHSATLDALLDGAPENYSTVINKKWEDIDTRVAEATRIEEIGVSLTEEEIVTKADKAIKSLEKYDGVQNVTYTSDPKGLTMAFDIMGGDGQLVSKARDLKLPFTVNDVTGGFNTKALTFSSEVLKGIVSPNFLFNKDRNRLVQNFERINYASGKVKQRLNETLVSAVQTLNKDELANVQNWLRKGDQDGEVFSFNKIVNEAGHSRKEFEAYASTRRIVDQAFWLKNKEVRQRLVAQGMREATIGKEKVISKQFDTVAGARGAYNGAEFTGVFVTDTEQLLHNSEKFEDLYKAGYKLVRTRGTDEFFNAGGTKTKWAMVRDTEMRDLPQFVMNQKTGYIPRALRDATYFVKKSTTESLDGGTKTAKKLTTMRYFDNQKDANRYIDLLEEEAATAGTSFDRKDYKVLGDREIPADILEEDYINARGGMYTSKRKTEGSVKYGLPGAEGELIDPFEAIQGYFANIGNRLPLSEYRIGIQQRWLNHAKGMGFLPKSWNEDFSQAKAALQLGSKDPKALSFLEKSFDQIQFMSRVPSSEEQRWAGNVRALTRTLENAGFDRLAKYAYKLQNSTPLDVLKSATFNLMLGSFNVSQLMVQAFGATIAMSINPGFAAKGVPRALAYRHIDLITDPKVRRAAALEVESKLGDLGKGFADEYALWAKSGLYEGVLSSSADYQAIAKGMPVDAGLLRRMWDKSTFFYKEGELVNSRISFATAVERWKGMNPGKKIDDDAFASILTRAEQFRLNMNNANKATIQRNWLRLFSQFQAINVRYLEAYTTSNFTKAEKARLFFGQTALFGAAGVPFMETSFGDFAAGLGVDAFGADQNAIVAARRGFTGWMFTQVMGVEADVSGRVALGNEFFEGIIEGFTTPQEIPRLFFGPSWTTIDRTMSVIQHLTASTNSVISADEMSKEDLLFATQVVAEAIAELPSSSRNLIKAHYLHNSSMFRNNAGEPTFIEDLNLQTEIFQALGFQPTSVQDFYQLKKMVRARDMSVKEAAKVITTIYAKLATGEQADHQRYEFATRSVLSSIDNPQDQIDVLNQVRRKLEIGTDPKARVINDVLERMESEWLSNTAAFLPSVQETLNREEQ